MIDNLNSMGIAFGRLATSLHNGTVVDYCSIIHEVAYMLSEAMDRFSRIHRAIADTAPSMALSTSTPSSSFIVALAPSSDLAPPTHATATPPLSAYPTPLAPSAPTQSLFLETILSTPSTPVEEV